MQYVYNTSGTCSRQIVIDVENNKVENVTFIGGCNGNLKAISKLIDGMSVDEIEEKLKGNTCGRRTTSCADQLAIAVKEAKEKLKNND